METPFNRRDLGYTVISRFEEALRWFIAENLPIYFSPFEDGIPKGVIEKAKARTLKSNWSEPYDILEEVDFPDLTEVMCFNGMYSSYFPHSQIDIQDFKLLMGELYSLRCKIAHVKGYFTSLDLDTVIDCAKQVSLQLGAPGDGVIALIQQLEQNPAQVAMRMPLEFTSDFTQATRIPNNIPTPDYEYEGGFVGRDEDLRKVRSLVLGDLHRVVTISGAGGVGKSALAMRLLQRLVLESEPIFSGIVWLSAKETKLSYVGVEDLEPTVKNYEDLLDAITVVMGFGVPSEDLEKKEEDVDIILGACNNRILIVIDNLETITDSRIIDFILDCPPKAKVLITSRRGLGQVERRQELRQLKEKEAVYLLRQVARDKQIESLVKLDDTTLGTYAKKVSCYPLAIKWVVGQVAIGKDLDTVVAGITAETGDISRFCFHQIFSALPDSAKKILYALSCFDDPPPSGVLNYVVNLSQHTFEDGINELVLVSLVIPEQYRNEQGHIATRLALLSLTRGYVRQQFDRDPNLKREIQERVTIVETNLAGPIASFGPYRFNSSDLGASTQEERVAAFIVQEALEKYRLGQYPEAITDYKRALDVAPRFASVYRSWAEMEARVGHPVEADKLLEKAAELNPVDALIWLSWGNIKKGSDRIKEAKQYYEKALSLRPNDEVIMHALAKVTTWLGEYAEAEDLLSQASGIPAVSSSLKQEIINRSSLAENCRRWAEQLRTQRNDKEAEVKFKEALAHCEKLIQLDDTDPRSRDLLRDVLIGLGHFYKRDYPRVAIGYFLRAVVEHPLRPPEIRDTIAASLYAAKTLVALGEIDEARRIFTPRLVKMYPLNSRLKLKEDCDTFLRTLYPGLAV